MKICVPSVMGPGPDVAAGVFAGTGSAGMGMVDVPMTRAGCAPDVWSVMTVVEVPVPMVMVEPGVRVWPAMMYWDAAFGVMVWEPIVIGPGWKTGVAGFTRGMGMVEVPMISAG